MTDPNTEMRTYEVGFSIDHGLRHLKCKEKITDSHRNTFKKEAKQFFSNLCSHIWWKNPLASYFASAACFLNPINLEEIPDTSENRFHNFLQKLVDRKLIPSLFADEAKREFHKFVSAVVCENKVLFCNYDVKFLSLDGFYIEYLKYSIHYRSFTHILKIVLTFIIMPMLSMDLVLSS